MKMPEITLGSLEPAWHRAQGWWTERSRREQMLLGALALVGATGLLLVAILTPLRAARTDAESRLRNASLLEAQFRAGGTGLTRTGKTRRGTASAIVTDSAAAARLTIQRIEPVGSDVRVVLADAPFDQVVGWVAEVEQTSRLRVGELRVERKGAPGMVSATILFGG